MKREVNYFRVTVLLFVLATLLYATVFRSDGRSVKDDRTKVRVTRSRRSTSDEEPLEPQRIVECPEVRSAMNFDREWQIDTTFYAKVAGDPSRKEIPVFASPKVSDAAIQEAFILVNSRILQGSKTDLLPGLIDSKVRVVVLSPLERSYQIPEYGGSQISRFVVLASESNLLCANGDAFRGQSLLVQSLADTVRLHLEATDAGFRRRLDGLFESAIEKYLYADNEQVTSANTYWSESVKNFYAANLAAYKICTRKSMRDLDPVMEEFISSIFGETGWHHICPTVNALGALDGCQNVPARSYPPPLRFARDLVHKRSSDALETEHRPHEEVQQAVAAHGGSYRKRRSQNAGGEKSDTGVEKSDAGVEKTSSESSASDDKTSTSDSSEESSPSPSSSSSSPDPSDKDDQKQDQPASRCPSGEIHCLRDDPTRYIHCDEHDGRYTLESAPGGTACKEEVYGHVSFEAVARRNEKKPSSDPVPLQEHRQVFVEGLEARFERG